MTVKITYRNEISKKNSQNLILFVDEKFNISGIKKYISNSDFILISDLLKTRDEKKKNTSFRHKFKKENNIGFIKEKYF